MSMSLVTFSLLLLLRIADGGEIPERPVTVTGLPVGVPGLRADPYQVAWSSDLTLVKVIVMHHGLAYPSSPEIAEIRRVLADGTESNAAYNLRSRKHDWIDPKLRPGDRVIFHH